MVLTFPLNRVASRLLLALGFYGLVTPRGLFLRLIGQDPLALRPGPERANYWADKPAGAGSYFRQS